MINNSLALKWHKVLLWDNRSKWVLLIIMLYKDKLWDNLSNNLLSICNMVNLSNKTCNKINYDILSFK